VYVIFDTDPLQARASVQWLMSDIAKKPVAVIANVHDVTESVCRPHGFSDNRLLRAVRLDAGLVNKTLRKKC